MFSRNTGRGALAIAASCLLANLLCATPSLTTIQDVLYKADGTRFNGVLQISWTSFQAADSSNIPTQSVTSQVTNGYLHVMLVPTTTATTPAVYNVTYNSDGNTQFTETWVVPPSTSPLTVADVRSSSTVGGAAALAQMQITDVAGLRTELNIRPTMGAAYAPSRAAIIDGSGGIAAAAGNLSDCLHVDGSSGPCGTTVGGSSNGFVDAESPSGVVDGSNVTFGLANSPNPASSVALFRNGLVLQNGGEYTVSGSTITFQSGSVPQPGDVLMASYRMSGTSGQSSSSSSSSTSSSTGPCSLYSLSNNGATWMLSVNGATAVAGPAIAASTTQDVPLFTLPRRSVVTGVREKTTSGWSGSGFSLLNLSVGDSVGGAAFYTPPSYDLTVAVSDTNFRATPLFKGASEAGSTVTAHLTANAALNSATLAGAVDIDVCSVTLP